MKKTILVKTDLDPKIVKLVGRTDHKTLMTWACDCAERVLPYFEKKYPEDKRPRQAIEAGRMWVRTGVFKMEKIRGGSLAAHAAARAVENDNAARSAARAAGQALATAHVPTHSIVAAIYATAAVRDATEESLSEAAVLRERELQYQHLLTLRGESTKAAKSR